MADTIVLIHSPLVGPGTWRRLAPELSTRGWQAVVPDLRKVMRGDGPFYPKLADAIADQVLRARSTAPVTLLAHSGAGAIVPLAAAAIAAVERTIFLDAILPHPRRSWREAVPPSLWQQLAARERDGVLPPWLEWWPKTAIESLFRDSSDLEAFKSELDPVPLAYFEERAPDLQIPAGIDCFYVQTSRAYAAEAEIAKSLGWSTRTMALNHLAMLTHPEQVTQAVCEIMVTG
jgi:pimeloyl-ACP methyl ester carboxylesterase